MVRLEVFGGLYNEDNKFNTSVRTVANKIDVSTLQRQNIPFILKLPGMSGFKGYNLKN